jgi:hypothetical protein
MPTRRSVKYPKTLRLRPDIENQSFDLIVKAPRQIRIDLEIIIGSVGVLFLRFGMKGMPFHRPIIRRTRAETSSPEIP